MPRRDCDCGVCRNEDHGEALIEDQLRSEGRDPEEESGEDCHCCGDSFDEAEVTTYAEETWCFDCLAENTTVCDRCGDRYYDDSSHISYVDEIDAYWCRWCRDNELRYCHECDNQFLEENMTYVEYEGLYFCESCAANETFYCYSCDNQCLSDSAHHLDAEYDRRVEGGYYSDEDLDYWRDDQYDILCATCANEAGWLIADGNTSAPSIMNYTFKPAIQVRYNEQGRIMDAARTAIMMSRMRIFGLELEVEMGREARVNQNNAAREVVKIGSGLFYCKSDASINNGFEIVSHPGVEEYWLKGEGHTKWDEVLAYLRDSGYQSHRGGRCGFHIHTNKASLSPLHRYNLVRFLHSPKMRMFLFGLSRRSEGQLSSYSLLSLPVERDDEDYTLRKYAKTVGKGGVNSGRGQVLNLQGQTAELRLFRGSLNPTTFWGMYQFYLSVLEYTNPKAYWLKLEEEPTWASYRQMVESFPLPHKVAELRTHLKELGI